MIVTDNDQEVWTNGRSPLSKGRRAEKSRESEDEENESRGEKVNSFPPGRSPPCQGGAGGGDSAEPSAMFASGGGDFAESSIAVTNGGAERRTRYRRVNPPWPPLDKGGRKQAYEAVNGSPPPLRRGSPTIAINTLSQTVPELAPRPFRRPVDPRSPSLYTTCGQRAAPLSVTVSWDFSRGPSVETAEPLRSGSPWLAPPQKECPSPRRGRHHRRRRVRGRSPSRLPRSRRDGAR